MFDEAYYVPAARDILNGVSSNPEHPFLGKAWISLGIATFGDNWFGWRIVPVSFSLLSLIVFYFVSKKFLGEKLATYSTALLGFENIFFIGYQDVVTGMLFRFRYCLRLANSFSKDACFSDIFLKFFSTQG